MTGKPKLQQRLRKENVEIQPWIVELGNVPPERVGKVFKYNPPGNF
jgi:hypothetical protein